MHGAVIFGCSGPILTEEERRFFRQADPAGFILFRRNVEDPGQLRTLTSALRDAVGRDALVLVDQEGGRVQRLTAPHWQRWLPALEQMDLAGPARAARSMFLRYRLIAAELRAVGVDVNCAPVADIARDTTHTIMLDRCYGRSVPVVLGAARAVAEGLLAGGVLPVVKHLPGYGLATCDSHLDLPRISADRETLAAQDFAPFRGLNDLPLAMTAHVLMEALDPDRPATQSPASIEVIRSEIGFDGLLMTDDLSMEALSGSMGERARLSIEAGCDVILHCNGDAGEMREVAAAAGGLSPAALARLRHAESLREPFEDAPREALLAELADLVPELAHV